MPALTPELTRDPPAAMPADQAPQRLSPEQIGATARWIHAHKGSTNHNLFGYTLYQYLRSAVAAVPYGVSMAATWYGFQKAEDFFAHLPSAAKAGSVAFHGKQFFASPLVRTGSMIATSFTLYRATSKIAKWLNEYLFNEQDSLEITQQKLDHLPEMLRAKAQEVYMPEMHSTFVSAFVLSALVAYGGRAGTSDHLTKSLAQTKQLLHEHGRFSTQGWGHFWKEAIANPEAKFVEQATANALGYSLFFELGDRRFKDKQISRGLWAGRSSSLGSDSRSSPSLLQLDATNNNTAHPNILSPVIGELPEGSRMNDSLAILTSEPSFLRFFMRRFIPTLAGIGAYTAIKMRGGKLFFGDFVNTEAARKEMDTFSGFMRNAWAEGAATSLFFVVPWVSDKYASVFDKVTDNLEAFVSGRSYEQVLAGYQPPRMTQGTQQQMPSLMVEKPAEHSLVHPSPEAHLGA